MHAYAHVVCMCVDVCVRVRVCARACACVCVRAGARLCGHVGREARRPGSFPGVLPHYSIIMIDCFDRHV